MTLTEFKQKADEIGMPQNTLLIDAEFIDLCIQFVESNGGQDPDRRDHMRLPRSLYLGLMVRIGLLLTAAVEQGYTPDQFCDRLAEEIRRVGLNKQ